MLKPGGRPKLIVFEVGGEVVSKWREGGGADDLAMVETSGRKQEWKPRGNAFSYGAWLTHSQGTSDAIFRID